jgi:hypothetical protein
VAASKTAAHVCWQCAVRIVTCAASLMTWEKVDVVPFAAQEFFRLR